MGKIPRYSLRYDQDGAEHGSRVASSYQTLQFFRVFYLLFCCFSYWMSTHLLPHDRHTLLEIGSSKPDFEFLNAGTLFTNTASEPFVWAARRGNAAGKKGRELASSSDRDAVPFDFFSQPFCWLTFSHCNWLCELRARISYQRETRDCCVICFTETWMSAMVTDSAHVHRSDRTKELTGKSRGGGRLFLYQQLVVWWKEPTLY